MNDDVDYFRKARHQRVFDDMRQRMGFTEWRPPVDPQMQINKNVIRGTASTDLLGTDDARH